VHAHFVKFFAENVLINWKPALKLLSMRRKIMIPWSDAAIYLFIGW